MLGFLGRPQRSRDLSQPRLFDETMSHRVFVADLKRARRSVIIESPYLTKRRSLFYAVTFEKLVKRGVSVRINTRQPIYHNPEMEDQARAIIGILENIGIKVRAYNDLRHRKLAIIDDSVLWEGSLNIMSHSCSREIMRRTDSRRVCQQMIAFTEVYN